MHHLHTLNTYVRNIRKGTDRTSRAGRHIIISFLLQGISIVVGFLYVPLLLSSLTQEKYGVWLTLTSIVSWFSFFDIGLGNGLRNRLTEALAVKDHDLARKYVSTTYALVICIFAVILLAFHVANPFINWPSILNTSAGEAGELYLVTSLVFTFFIFRFIVQLIGVIYLADQRPSMNSAINAAGNLVSLVVVFFLTKTALNNNLVWLSTAISVIPVLLFIAVTIYAFRYKYHFLRPSFRKLDFRLSRSLMNLGFRFFFMQVTAIIIFSTSSVFIARFYGPAEVVTFNVVYKYFQLPVMIFAIIITPLWSAVTDAFTRDDYEWLRSTMKRLNRLALLFSVGIIAMVFPARYFIGLWLGDQVTIPFNLILIMAGYSIVMVMTAPYSHFINGTGKVFLTTSLTLAAILLYFSSVYVFGHLFPNSAGIVLAIIVTSLLGGIMQPIQTYRILGKRARGIWFR